MPCTTILVGKNASYNGSTMVARNDDSPSGVFHVKKMVVVEPSAQPRVYHSKISHVTIELPDNPLRYTLMPNVDKKEGIWGAAGINSCNVGMSATETITSNPRVLGADPYVEYSPKTKKKKEMIGGIGEEDLVAIVLPYIRSAREGVLRLGELLERYGTYEPNGIAFNDCHEVWWLETIGGHHWIAKKVPDDRCVIMPNQFGMDEFDFMDAYGEKRENLCSKDLKEFVEKNHLYLGKEKDSFNPRLAFGSHDDSDHIYNTPRAWYMGRYLCPKTIRWEGENSDFSPESDDIPWSLVSEKKITIEDVKYLLSSHYQGTDFDPYAKGESAKKNMYRSIGVNRTSFMALLEIRNGLPQEIAAIEWVCFGSNVFNALVPLYANTDKIPSYFGNTTLRVSTDNFYWSSRLIGALSDPHFQKNSIHIERYQNAVANRSHALLRHFDELFLAKKDISLLSQANEEISEMAKEETDQALDHVLFESSMLMKNAFARSDN